MKSQSRLNALRFELAVMKLAPSLRVKVAAEKNRYITDQIKAFKSSGKVNEGIEKTHIKRMDDIISEHYKKVMKRTETQYESLIEDMPKSAAKLELKEADFETALASFYKKYGAKNIVTLSKTTTDDIRRAIRIAQEEGDSETVAIRASLRAKGVSVYRADVISRTETHTASQYASNFMARETAKQNGFTYEKAWLSVNDDRTRDSHADMRPEYIADDEMFDVGGEMMDYAGDQSASPDNIINCRCQTIRRVVLID
jgi:hypothetical protein